jgi:Flp pilus assembly pilin Flp
MIKKFLRDETGLELSEYAVAAALVAIAVVGAFGLLGEAITGKIGELTGHINGGGAAPAP